MGTVVNMSWGRGWRTRKMKDDLMQVALAIYMEEKVKLGGKGRGAAAVCKEVR